VIRKHIDLRLSPEARRILRKAHLASARIDSERRERTATRLAATMALHHVKRAYALDERTNFKHLMESQREKLRQWRKMVQEDLQRIANDSEDRRLIAQARARVASTGCADVLDRWRLRAAARREQREVAEDAEASHAQLEQTVCNLIDNLSGLVEDLGADSGQMWKRLRDLERELAELRGELRGMRGDRRDDDVIIPRDAWRRKGAAA
jgi:hypothetical protein